MLSTQEKPMTALAASLDRASFLRRVLAADAATCFAMAFFLLLLERPLVPLLGLPGALLDGAGFALIPIAAFIAWVATRTAFLRTGTWIVIAGNAAWVAGSLLLLVPGWFSLTPLGSVFVAAQALGVTILGALEYVGLRRT
jgi:hypothetical protein